MRCIECGAEDGEAHGWVAFLAHDPDDDDPPEVGIYCADCAEREFGGELSD